MEIAIILLIIIVSVLLTIIVLVQNSKGGGLASNIGISSNQFGVKKTSDFLEKMTWGLAVALVVLCLGVNLLIRGNGDTDDFPSSVNVEKAKESRGVPALPKPETKAAPEGSAPDAPAAPAAPEAPAPQK